MSTSGEGGDVLLSNIGELVTNDRDRNGLLGVIADAAVVIRGGRVGWVGPGADLPGDAQGLNEIDVHGRAVVPGFVDSHTHIVFAGDRAEEFSRRLRGESYEQILESGGGILSTVDATRLASERDLFESAADRAKRMLAGGTTTLEVKSGYGLDVETEAKMLRVAARLDEELAIDIVPTFLGAHVLPGDYRDRRADYVELVAGEMMEACAPLAKFCDVFTDRAAFTVGEARRILESAREAGLGIRLHADQLDRVGAARLAAELGAASADHLDFAGYDDLAALEAAGTVATLLPAVSFSMRLPFPDGREIWDSGVTVALATDCNPGTAYVESMPFVVALASLEMGLTPAESLWAATRGGALAVGEPGKGILRPGAVGDVVVLDAPSHLHIPYRPVGPLVWKVVKDGEVVA